MAELKAAAHVSASSLTKYIFASFSITREYPVYYYYRTIIIIVSVAVNQLSFHPHTHTYTQNILYSIISAAR